MKTILKHLHMNLVEFLVMTIIFILITSVIHISFLLNVVSLPWSYYLTINVFVLLPLANFFLLYKHHFQKYSGFISS